MRKLAFVIIITTFLIACSNNESSNRTGDHQHGSSNAQVGKDVSKKSIPSETKKHVGNTEIKINYYSPGVRGRVIWGGLVSYDSVWVTGAHSATTLEVGKDFQIGDKQISAGKYAIFTIPGKKEWIVIINRNWNQHLADDYSQSDDVVRIKVKPIQTEQVIERLKYEIEETGERTADIIVSWEKLRVAFPIEIRQ